MRDTGQALAHPVSLQELAQGDEQSQRRVVLGPGARVVQQGVCKQRHLHTCIAAVRSELLFRLHYLNGWDKRLPCHLMVVGLLHSHCLAVFTRLQATACMHARWKSGSLLHLCLIDVARLQAGRAGDAAQQALHHACSAHVQHGLQPGVIALLLPPVALLSRKHSHDWAREVAPRVRLSPDTEAHHDPPTHNMPGPFFPKQCLGGIMQACSPLTSW